MQMRWCAQPVQHPAITWCECVNTLLPSHDLPPDSCHRAQDNANDPLTTMDAVEVIEAFAAIPAALPLLLVRPSCPLSPGTSIVLHPSLP